MKISENQFSDVLNVIRVRRSLVTVVTSTFATTIRHIRLVLGPCFPAGRGSHALLPAAGRVRGLCLCCPP